MVIMAETLLGKLLPMFLLCLVSMLVGFFIILWFQRGFLISFLRVKASRGKHLLVWVITPMGKTAVFGKVKGDTVEYKFQGEKHLVDISKPGKYIYFSTGVRMVDVPLGFTVPVKLGTYDKPVVDSNITDNLVNRALTRPTLKLNKQDTILLVLVIGLVLLLLWVWWQNGQILQGVNQLVGKTAPAVVP